MPEPIVIADLLAEAPIPRRGIHSQTISDQSGISISLFAFAEGEELSEHTSARGATIHVLAGTFDLAVGHRRADAGPGTWVRMAAGTAHSLRATSPAVMLLYLFPRD